MNLTEEQVHALRILSGAFSIAGKEGLLDELKINLDNPDSINDVIAAIDYTREELGIG